MNWMTLWTILLIAGMALFGGLAIVVTIGGFRDIRAMLSRIEAQHREQADDSES